MRKFSKPAIQFLTDRRGGAAIEYSIVAAGVAGAIVAVITATGTSLEALWTSVKNALG